MKKSISEDGAQKPLPSRDNRMPATTGEPSVWPPSPRCAPPRPRVARSGPALTGRIWLDKTLGWIAAGLPFVFAYLIIPAILYAGKGEIEVYRRMGQMSYFLPVLTVTFVCVVGQVALYFQVRPHLPALARGFGCGLWIWTPLLLLTLCWPMLAPLK